MPGPQGNQGPLGPQGVPGTPGAPGEVLGTSILFPARVPDPNPLVDPTTELLTQQQAIDLNAETQPLTAFALPEAGTPELLLSPIAKVTTRPGTLPPGPLPAGTWKFVVKAAVQYYYPGTYDQYVGVQVGLKPLVGPPVQFFGSIGVAITQTTLPTPPPITGAIYEFTVNVPEIPRADTDELWVEWWCSSTIPEGPYQSYVYLEWQDAERSTYVQVPWTMSPSNPLAVVKSNWTVNTVSDLLTWTPLTDKTPVQLLGYRTTIDGGGGPLVWDAASTRTPDGGTVFKPTAATLGRWIRTTPGWNALQYGAVGDGLVDDQPAIQALVTQVEDAGGGTVVLPAGKTFKISQPIRVSKSHMHFEGGGTLLLDSVAWSTVAIPTVGSVAAGILAWSGTSQRRYVDPLTPYNPTYDSALLEDIKIRDLYFQDDGSYTSGFLASRNPIGLFGVKNSEISGCTIYGSHSEAILGDICWRDVQIHHNTFVECAHDGIAPAVMDECLYTNNVFHRVWQPFECGLLRSEISNNVLSQFANLGIWVGSGSLGIAILGTISNNLLLGYNSPGPIVVSNYTDGSFIYEANILNNTLRGLMNGSSAHAIMVIAEDGTLCATTGAVKITGNTIVEDPAQDANWGASISLNAADAQPSTSQIDISDNTIVHNTGYGLAAISVHSGTPTSRLRNNAVRLTTTLRGSPLVAGAFDINTNVTTLVNGNTVNGSVVTMQVIDSTSSGTDIVLDTLGRTQVDLAPSVATTINEINAQPGSFVVIRAMNGNVTIKHGGYIYVHTGADLPIPAGNAYLLWVREQSGSHTITKGQHFLV